MAEPIDEVIELKAEQIRERQHIEFLQKEIVQSCQTNSEHIKNLQATVAEVGNIIHITNETIKNMALENKRLTDDCTTLRKNEVDTATKNEGQFKEMTQKFDREHGRADKAEEKAAELKIRLDKNLKGYSKWKRFWSLFTK